ncbi:MAG: aspartate aminotransferase family protein [Proteobacteria bacterium]|nr:MAG: aspartate aminotransferase family protein [Pseudomonadota bacterium]
MKIPAKGRERGALLEEMAGFGAEDADFRGGRTWSMVYWAGEAHHHLVEKASNLFLAGNALNPMAFKSLKRMEHEVVQMTASMLNAPASAVGTMTSGGTESLLMAVKAYRDRANKNRPWIRRPNMVVPETIHVAFDKASHYFGVDKRVAPVGPDGKVDVAQMRRLVNRNTVMLAASAPQYPSGAVDPIAEVGALAKAHKLPLHVDACFGGFILPWLERLGVPMPIWDFRVPGVTSISADVHKYGYSPKGASVVVYRDMSYLRHQFFVSTGWSGGVYISPSMQGTRGGGAIAGAWASLNAMGEQGYLERARAAWETAEKLRTGIAGIDGLRVLGSPESTVVTWASARDGVDVFAVADQLAAKGWAVDRQHKPPSVHCSVTAANAPVVDDYLVDLAAAVAHVEAHPELAREGEAAVYGLMAKVPLKGLVAREVLKVMESMYGPDGGAPELSATAPGDDDLVAKLVARYGDQVFGLIERLGAVRDRLRRVVRRP